MCLYPSSVYIHKHKRNFVTKILADVILAWFSWAKVSLGRKFQPRNFWWCKDLAWFSLVKTAFWGTLHTSSYDVMFLCMYLCIYGVGPYIHKYIRKNITSKPKSSPNVGQNANGSRMYTNRAGFTDVHKYENPSRTYTNTRPLTYISAYALTKKNSRKSCQVILAHCQWVKMDLGPFFQPRNFWWWMDLAHWQWVERAHGRTQTDPLHT